MTYEEKIQNSIKKIQEWEEEANKWGGYTVGFSGGKDSQVLLDLFKKSGVKFRAAYNVTTNDPPESVYFIKKNYPEVEFIHPKTPFLQLIKDKHMLPTHIYRYCCAILKESTHKGFVAVGVRREESSKRAHYSDFPEFKGSKGSQRKLYDPKKMTKNRQVLFMPIIDWLEWEVWQYIEDNNLPVNPCYDTQNRVGCIFCPYASKRELLLKKEQYPKHYKLLLNAIQVALDKGYLKQYQPLTPEEVFEWWITKEDKRKYFYAKQNQTKLFDD